MFDSIRDSLDNTAIILDYSKFNPAKTINLTGEKRKKINNFLARLHSSRVQICKVIKTIKNHFNTIDEYYTWRRTTKPKTIKDLIKAYLKECSKLNREDEEDARIMLLASLPMEGELTHWTIQLMRNN